jgi:hypothetical protein
MKEKVKFITSTRLCFISIVVLAIWVPIVLDSTPYDACYKGVSSLFGGTYLEVDCSSPNVDARDVDYSYSFNPSGRQIITLLVIIFVLN